MKIRKEKNNKQNKIKLEEKPKMKSPIDFFFKLGDWATKGDPIKIQDFQLYNQCRKDRS